MRKYLHLMLLLAMTFVLPAEEPKAVPVEKKEVTVEAKSEVTAEIKEKKKMKEVVKKGDKVNVYYEGTLTDGKVFDKSQEGKPLEFTVGAGKVIKGFDKGVEGMKLNEEKTIKIKAEDAYGKRDETMIRKIPKTVFPPDFKFKKDMQIGLKDQSGQPFPATVVDFDDKDVTVDLNFFLAGKDLVFKVKIVSIE